MTRSISPLRSITLLAALAVTTHTYAIDEVPAGLTNDPIDQSLLDTIDAALPERSQVNAGFLDTSYDPNITLSQDAGISMTFVDEGAGYRNTVGYFTYAPSTLSSLSFGDIDSNGNGRISLSELSNNTGATANLAFPNFSESGGGGQLNPGDTLQLNDGNNFASGSTTGFFVMANAWTGSGVKSVDRGGDPNVYYSVDFLNPENSSGATIDNTDSNARHVAMMFASEATEEIIVGFEDLKRPYGDNDFNDAIFIIRTDPVTAIQAVNIPTVVTQTISSARTLNMAPIKQYGASAFSLSIAALIYLMYYISKHKLWLKLNLISGLHRR